MTRYLFLLLAILAILALAGPAVAQNQQHGDRPGTDAGANAPSLAGLNLLATIAANTTRQKAEIYANCTAGITIVLDDQAGSVTATIIPIAGPSVNGGQGGSYTTSTHTGRIRIYSSSASCQMAARAW